jgi:hypothetical protein
MTAARIPLDSGRSQIQPEPNNEGHIIDPPDTKIVRAGY